MLVHPLKNLIVVRSSNKKVRNAMQWAKMDTSGNIVSRKISGSAFIPTLYELFNWNKDYKYRIRGVKKQKNNVSLMIFDIKDATIFIPQTTPEEQPMEKKNIFVIDSRGGEGLPVVEGSEKYFAGVVAPIISEGDSIGSVMMVSDKETMPVGEVEKKLCQSAAGFLGKQMEE